MSRSAPTRVRLLGQAVCGGDTSPSQPVQARRDGKRSPIHVMAPSKTAAFGHLWALQNTLSEMLGHASVAITLDLYSHFLPDMQADAVATIGQLLYG
jgi:hypothetical protein